MGKPQREKLLLKAAFDGNLGLLKKMARGLQDAGAQGEAAVLAATTDRNGATVLHLAATEGRRDVLKYLVEELRFHVDPRNARGETPLFLSAFFGRTSATTYLLNHGADPIVVSISGSPLHGAAGKGHCEIVELLLSRGTSVDLVSLCGTPLHTAALYGQDGTMKILLEHHADPNKVLNVDDTTLYIAIQAQSLECVKLLIEAAADLSFIDFHGFTYVMIAVNYGTPEIIKCLLDAGVNPNIPDEVDLACALNESVPGIMTSDTHRRYKAMAPTIVRDVLPLQFIWVLKGKREIVEMLFPVTSPISRIPNWSIDGIVSHMNIVGLKPMDKHLFDKKRASLKLQATDAFKRKEYLSAGQMYTDGMKLGPSDTEHATLLANRSICWLRLENGKQALADATECRMMRPQWPKARYRQGAAFMLLKDYGKACEAFADALKMDPTNVEIENAIRECLEAMKNTRRTEK